MYSLDKNTFEECFNEKLLTYIYIYLQISVNYFDTKREKVNKEHNFKSLLFYINAWWRELQTRGCHISIRFALTLKYVIFFLYTFSLCESTMF